VRNKWRTAVLNLLLIQLCILTLPGIKKSIAGTQGQGRLSVQGSIIETPCAIDIRSRDQSVDMGVTSKSAIARDGRSAAHPFSIWLVNCHLARLDAGLPDWRYFRATFDGHDDNGNFALDGEARGVAVEVADAAGNIAHPGEPLAPGGLTTGDRQLNYILRLVGNRRALKAGDFRTTLRFRLDYN